MWENPRLIDENKSSAYMLVYLRTDLIPKIQVKVTEDDMPNNIKKELIERRELKTYSFFKV
jgi:hypothetical protein